MAVVAGDERVEVAGTGFGPRNVPHLVSVYGQSFNIEIAPTTSPSSATPTSRA